ncbi:MAG: hypothetical protein IJ011_09315 [Clostridia bacterium]|nr:hypothetical protein [Clostridia bacterium]
MKRILSAVLCALLLLSALCFVSCESEPEVIESINGMSAKQAAAEGLKKLDESERYRVTVDGEIQLNALVATIPVGIDNFYENTTDGDNMHYKFTDEDLLFIDNEQLFSLLKGYDKEVWYVDGTRYSINTAGEKVIDDSGDRKPSDVISKIVDSISEEELNTAVAYTKDGDEYILITVNIEEFNVGTVACKVFLSDTGAMEKATLEGTLYGLGVVLTLNFEYGDIAKITAPENFVPTDSSAETDAETEATPESDPSGTNGKENGRHPTDNGAEKGDASEEEGGRANGRESFRYTAE